MPYKLKNPYRHKFPKAQYKLTNWPEYNAALKSRGKINLWFTNDIIDAWYYKSQNKKSPGRQKTYSNLALLTMRTIGTIYKQRLRQTEGLVKSIVQLMNLDLQVPDFSTLSRRTEELSVPNLSDMLDKNEAVDVIVDSTGLKIFGIGEWLACKHNLKKRRGWRKLHIAIDRTTKKILSSELTTEIVADHIPVPKLLNGIKQAKNSVSGNCAYDVISIYNNISALNAKAIIPPRERAEVSADCLINFPARAANINTIADIGKQKWQKESGYNYRSLVEMTMARYKKIVGDRVHSRKMPNQKVESKIGCYILNRLLEQPVPKTVKIKYRASN